MYFLERQCFLFLFQRIPNNQFIYSFRFVAIITTLMGSSNGMRHYGHLHLFNIPMHEHIHMSRVAEKQG